MVVDGDGQSNVVVANRHKMTRFTLDNHGLHSANSRVNVPVLCIDADFEPEVAKVFFPDIECLRINVERNAHVTQVYSALNTKKDFIRDRKKENNLKKIETFIRDISSKHERILVVSYKDIKPLLTLPEKCKFIHFGGLRGLNKFSDCDAVIVVGRHQLPIQAVESQAAALWWDADTPLTLTGKYKKQLRGYRLEDGEAGVKVDVCADSRSQLLMELQREKEFLQGVDRIRLINEGPQKSIYILTYLPAPITVNRLVSQTELFNGVLPIRSILEESGYAVLPLQPQYLHKNYKSLFTSKSVSKNAPAEEGLSATLLDFLLQAKEPITIGSTEMDIIEYKIEDQRGKYSKALVPKRMLTNKACVILRSLHNKDVDCVRTSKRSLQDLKPMQQSDELDGMMDLFEQYCAYDSSIHELCFTLPAH